MKKRFFLTTIGCVIILIHTNANTPLLPDSTVKTNKSAEIREESLKNMTWTIDRKYMTINLSWSKSNNVEYYTIYRKSGTNGTLSVFTTIPGNLDSFIDTRVKAKNSYTYIVKATLKSGGKLTSKEIIIQL